MGSTLQDESSRYLLPLLPSTGSLLHGEENDHSELAENENKSAADATGGADAAPSRNVEYAVPPETAPSRSISFASNVSAPRSSSSARYSPRSLKSPSPIIQENTPTQQTFPDTPKIIMSPSPVTRSNATAETVSSLHSIETEGQYSNSSLSPSTVQPPPAISDVNARRSAAIMPIHPGAESVPMSAIYDPEPSPRTMTSEDDADNFSVRPSSSHPECYSRRDVHIKRCSWLYVTLICLSVYSTVLSGLWLVVSIVQPRYGRGISTGVGWQLTPSTATLLATLAARTIELSFVTVFVAVLGQVLTRRAFSTGSKGVSLAEMTMRNWVIQPGSLITHWEGLPKAGITLLGALTLTATFCSLLYTTASDAMVSPKLTLQNWENVDMKGSVKVAYADPYYVSDTCQTPLRKLDREHSGSSCLDVTFSGQSYHSLIAYMTEWSSINTTGNSTMHQLEDRPTGKHNLFDNTTMDSSWIETEYSDVRASFRDHERVINNVTLAMPHPGVYAAATNPINGILQPNELLGQGQYKLEAAVVSPVVNVLCVNMNRDELSPIVYTEWPNATKTQGTEIPGQTIGIPSIWNDDVPPPSPKEWYNSTVVDDIFRWGEQYNRRPPIFPMYPIDYNMITNISLDYSESLWVLAKSPRIDDFTLCEMRSWVTPKCSTAFELSGTSGGHMKAHCEDPDNTVSYERVYPESAAVPPIPSGDWRNLADEWRLSINLNGGAQNNNASNARILTDMILTKPELDLFVPSMAESLAVLATSTLVAGSLDSTFKPTWTYVSDVPELDEPIYETFRARMQTQQYASAHTEAWQGIFYPVLLLVFMLNVLCLLYLLFGTSLTSPPSESISKLRTTISSRLSFQGSMKRPTAAQLERVNECDSDNDNDNENEQNGYVNANAYVGGIDAGRRNRNGNRNRHGKAADGLVTDYTEPQNLFALAINSPPSRALAGSCGHGPDGAELVTAWHVRYAPGANHYYFESVRDEDRGVSSGADLLGGGGGDDDDGLFGKSYKRLSSRRAWL